MAVLLLFCLIFVALTAGEYPKCTKANTAFCEDHVVGVSIYNIIFRCQYDIGRAAPGNCNDELYNVPPVGIKYGYCWETSPTSGDAQCTFNCVSVTAANGTTFYPVGCDRKNKSPTFGNSTSSTSLKFFGPSTATSVTTSQTSKSSSTATMRVGGSGVWQVLAVVGAFAL